MSTSSLLVRQFDSAVPKRFLEGTVKSVFDVWARAHHDGLALPMEIRRYHQPARRTALLESEWISVAAMHPGRLVGLHQPNENGSYHFTEITAKGWFVLTASCVDAPSELPRHAKFRETRAQSSQLSLLTGTAPTPASSLRNSGFIYAVLVHGAADPLAKYPDFARIRFPLADGGAHEEDIDLFVRFRRMLPTLRGERLIIVPKPTLRPKRRTGDDGPLTA